MSIEALSVHDSTMRQHKQNERTNNDKYTKQTQLFGVSTSHCLCCVLVFVLFTAPCTVRLLFVVCVVHFSLVVVSTFVYYDCSLFVLSAS